MRLERTLVEMLEHRAGLLSGPFFEYHGGRQSLADIYVGATQWVSRFRHLGVKRGDRVAIAMLSTSTVLEAFFGALMCRAAVVPLPAPNPLVSPKHQVARLAAALQLTKPRAIVGPLQAIRVIVDLAEGLKAETIALEDRGLDEAAPEYGDPGDLALVQLTSGSMGRPRAVALSHANVLANLRNIVEALELDQDDRGVSWLPLHHDMGLVGMVLSMIYGSTRTMLIPPETFVLHPVRWLKALTRFHGTISTAPNFGYQLCVDRVPSGALGELNLTQWRKALSGAEPVRPETLEAFAQRFSVCGFRRRAFMPVYGLAEAALAVAFPPLDREPVLDCIDPDALRRSGRAETATEGRCFVSVGRAFSDSEIRIVDPESGNLLAERQEGEIAIRGPSVTCGYFGATDETDRAIQDGWLLTGDLGYLADGELYVTGRLKAIVIRAGQNYHAEEIEAFSEKVVGIRRGCSAAFSIDGPLAEEVVVVVERSTHAEDSPRELAKAVADSIERGVGLRPDRVYVVAPRMVPKTTSGKVERYRCRNMVLNGQLPSMPYDPHRTS